MKFTLLVLLVFACALPAAAQENPAGSVREFGAIGDGTADDTPAFQQAVDAGMGGVFVPKGRYRLTKPVVIELDRVGFTSIRGDGTARVVMAGPGPAFHFVGTHDSSADPSRVRENVWENQRMPALAGIEIIGEHPEAVGVELTGTMQALVRNVAVRKALHGVHLTTRNRNVIITGCHFYENVGVGIFMDNVDLHQINIGDCHISYNAGGGVVARDGSVRNIQVGNCDIEANMVAEGPETANVFIDAPVGSIGEIAITGCTIQHTQKGENSANIRLRGSSADLKSVIEQVAIANNIFLDADICVDIAWSRDVVITGNVFLEGKDHSILVQNASNIVVNANTIDRNYPARPDNISVNGITFRDCEDCIMTGCQIKNVWRGPAAVLLENCRRMTINACSVIDCDGAGIKLSNTSDAMITACRVQDSRTESAAPVALAVEGGSGNLIANNMLHGDVQAPEDTVSPQ